MRERLKQINGVRALFRGTVADFSSRLSYGHEKKTMLLCNVRDRHGREMTDHVWFLCAKWNEGFKIGDEIRFEARVTKYWKGYHDNRSMDYKLSHPTKVRKIEPISTPLFEGPVPPSPTVQEPLFI